jgi:hypothetical protein
LPIGAAAPSGSGLKRGGVFWTRRNALANVRRALLRRDSGALGQRMTVAKFPRTAWIRDAIPFGARSRVDIAVTLKGERKIRARFDGANP